MTAKDLFRFDDRVALVSEASRPILGPYLAVDGGRRIA